MSRRDRQREQESGGVATMPAEESHASDLPADVAPGIYYVQWGSAPRTKVDTRLSAGPDAEKIAWDIYRNHWGIVRDDITPDILELTDADPLSRAGAHGGA